MKKAIGLLVAMGLAFAVGVLGCGGEVGPEGAEVDSSRWVVPAINVAAPALDGVEQTSHALSGIGFFGASGFGTNVFECKSFGCYCDPAPGSGMDGMTTDCKDMQKAGVCDPNSTLVCGATAGRAICQCIKKGQGSSIPCPSAECPLANYILATGLWKNGGNYFRRLPDSDRACWSPNPLIPPGVTVPEATGSNLTSLVTTYSNQQCTPEEASGMVTMTPSGYFQTPDTLVHFKVNRRSCQISLPQWNARRFNPTITQQTFAQAEAHRSWLWCTDRELQAGGFLN